MAAPITIAEKPLSKKKQRFIDAYIETNDDLKALEIAGYAWESRSAKNKARKLRTELAVHLEKALRVYIKSTDRSLRALHVVEHLMDADSEAVALNAAKDVLSRAGLDPKEEVSEETPIQKLTNKSLDVRILELMDKLKGDDFIDVPSVEVVDGDGS